MVILGDVAQGRDNNLNLIRMIAALAVLVSHAYPIALGPEAVQPLQRLTGNTLGGLAVAVFFVISGFLIAESYARSRSWQDFIAARVLRLWPALIVSLAVVAFLMGPIVTTLSPQAYFADPVTWLFMVKNLLLAVPQYWLPGVFADQPYPNVEGSIWTLFYEVVCYFGVFVAGLLGLLRQRWLLSGLILAFAAVAVAVDTLEPNLHLKIIKTLELGLPFALGTLMWLWKDRLPLNILGVAGFLALAVALAATPFFNLALVVFLAYATFWAAYVPGGWIRAYNRLGDYSYGVYIYAFPAQGLAVWLTGGDAMNPYLNMLISLPLTLIPSVLSWHYLEKPALGLRRHPVLARPPVP